MPSKQAQRREVAKNAKNRDALSFRGLSVRAESVNSESRTVETVISTENPVPMMDWERWEVIPEVLRSDGAILPTQIPLLDNHNRYSTSDQLGSAREIRTEKSEVVGQLRFASSADEQWNLVREGHITDVSAGYQVLERTYIPKGTTQKVMGRDYTGPVNVVTKWKLREVSLTPIGADEQAKLRGFDPSAIPSEKGFAMNEQLRSLLESRGMPKDLADDEARQQWAVENNFGEKKPDEKPQGVKFDADVRKLIEESTAKAAADAARLALEEQQKRAEERASIIASVLKIAGVQECRELSEKLAKCATREQIETAVLDFKAERQQSTFPSSVSVVSGPQQHDKFESAMRTALIERCLDAVSMPVDASGQVADDAGKRREAARQQVFPVEKRSKDAHIFRHASVYDMARTYVESVYGIRSIDFSRDDIAVMALFGPQRAAETLGLNINFRDAGAYHTTGSFANLTLDAMNKSMMMGYTEAPSTWQSVMRTGADATDFKELHRMRLGSIPNIPVWPDNTEPKPMSIADAREHYAVESRSASIDFSYRLLVNDDMNALSRVPGQFGQSFRRTINTFAWSLITANPTMSDGVALFAAATGNRKRTNLTTGAGAPSTTTLQTLTALMMQMRGENTPENAESPDILGIMPRYIVGPVALRTTILQLVLSVYDPASTGSLAYNTASQLIPVIEPLLDAASTTAWYLFADPSQIDTVEISFLSGQRTPQTRQELDISTLTQRVYALQTFGGKPLNHRGIQKHAGA